MRAVIQRVSEASVMVGGEVVGQIKRGFLIFLGIEENDTVDDLLWLSMKIVNMRIMNDGKGLMNIGLKDMRGDILLVSQFTLQASTKKGNRPSFLKAAKSEKAIPLYEKITKQLEFDLGKKIQTGQFGADMQVHLINDGPVTIIIDSQQKE
jgi:D-aminoacyl-tRNA deacylase